MKMLASGVIVIHVDMGFLADWHEPYFPYIIDKGMFGLVFISSIWNFFEFLKAPFLWIFEYFDCFWNFLILIFFERIDIAK